MKVSDISLFLQKPSFSLGYALTCLPGIQDIKHLVTLVSSAKKKIKTVAFQTHYYLSVAVLVVSIASMLFATIYFLHISPVVHLLNITGLSLSSIILLKERRLTYLEEKAKALENLETLTRALSQVRDNLQTEIITLHTNKQTFVTELSTLIKQADSLIAPLVTALNVDSSHTTASNAIPQLPYLRAIIENIHNIQKAVNEMTQRLQPLSLEEPLLNLEKLLKQQAKNRTLIEELIAQCEARLHPT